MPPCCCGIDLDSGVPVDAGGGPAPAAAGWSTVYEVDFRDVFAAQGAIDLNIVGSSFTFQGITWETPTVGNSGVDMNVSSSGFGIAAGGMVVTGQGGGSIVATGPSMTSIFANLLGMGANSATPFEADPTRAYLLQCYVAASTADTNGEEAGVGLYKVADIPQVGGNISTTFNTFGFNQATLDVPSCTAGSGGSPSRLNRLDLLGSAGIDFDCPTIHYAASGKLINVFAASFSDTGDWPDEDTFRSIGSFAPTAQFSGTVGDPDGGWRFTLGMAGGGVGTDFTIERARLRQL